MLTVFCSVDCLYTPTNQLHHTFEACVIQPGQSIEVAFTFYPREAKKYVEIVTFEINGLSRQDIEIRGQGTEMKVSCYQENIHLKKSRRLKVVFLTALICNRIRQWD